MPSPLPWGQKRHSRQPWPPVLRREATALRKQPQSCGCGRQVTWMAEGRVLRNPGYTRVAKASVPCPRQARAQPLWEALLVALPQVLFLSMSLKCHPVNTNHSNPCLPTAVAICIQTTLSPLQNAQLLAPAPLGPHRRDSCLACSKLLTHSTTLTAYPGPQEGLNER